MLFLYRSKNTKFSPTPYGFVFDRADKNNRKELALASLFGRELSLQIYFELTELGRLKYV
jgi:hypothetical protein